MTHARRIVTLMQPPGDAMIARIHQRQRQLKDGALSWLVSLSTETAAPEQHEDGNLIMAQLAATQAITLSEAIALKTRKPRAASSRVAFKTAYLVALSK